jgi:DNA repair protein RecN (Recombination protein N)
MGPRTLLKSITIQDLAVVRHLDLEFQEGLTVVTGETGAGKSIVLDALGLLLGDRADSTLVRTGAARAVLSAAFEGDLHPELQELLAIHELDSEKELLLRRVISSDGRSRAFCNETPITLQTLREIGARLVDMHGQHEHYSLLQKGVQRSLLDAFGKLGRLFSEVSEAHRDWHAAATELSALRAAGDPADRMEFLRFQLEELGEARISAEELVRLEQEHRRAAHVQRLGDGCEEIAARLFTGDRCAARQLRQASAQLQELAGLDPALGSMLEMLEQASINLTEAERELAQYNESLSARDPGEYRALEQRLGNLHDLARKHRCEMTALPEVVTRLTEELAALDGREARVFALEKLLTEARQRYDAKAGTLSTARLREGTALGQVISEILQQLGMPHARFEVALTPLMEPSAHGCDDVEFLVSTNPDIPPRPLRKVASGGELSRTSLAIQVATAGTAQVPTLVYDEIDTGIGGRVATIVARHLQSIAETRQILCVTHLAQVASAGAQHLYITKSVEQGQTETRAVYLDKTRRVDEIARMLGGDEGSAKAKAHARELLGS